MPKSSLLVLNGPLAGRRFPIGTELTMGRHPRMHVHLDDPQVSRWHASIERKGDSWVLRDVVSSNGVFVNGERVAHHVLNQDDEVQLGSTRFRFSVGAPASLQNYLSEAQQRGERAPSLDTASRNPLRDLLTRVQDDEPERERELQRRLAAVFSANQVIASERSVQKVLTGIVDQVFGLLEVSTAAVLLQREGSGGLEVVHSRTTQQDDAPAALSSSIVERVVQRREAIITTDAASDPRFVAGKSIMLHNISAAMCAPLACHDVVFGALYVDARGLTTTYEIQDLELLAAFAGPAGIALENARHVEKLERSYRETLIALANAIELRDHYTVGHTWRVTGFALRVARRMGWPQERLDQVEMGGVLHDIGKIAVDDAILRKPGRLTDDEFAIMKIHPERGAQLLQEISHLESVVPYCLYHHERFDGAGYPFGLAGQAIPEEGRLIAVADAFDAMTSHRPYRSALDPDEAARRIAQCSGTQFDPRFADALLECYRAGDLDDVLQEHPDRGRGLTCPYCSTNIPLAAEVTHNDTVACQVCSCVVRVLLTDDEPAGVIVSRTGREDTDPFGMPGAGLMEGVYDTEPG